MNKRVLCLILIAALLIVIPIAATADSTGICFTAVGDNNLMELSSMAVFSGGVLYVPATAFSYFGIYTNYFDSDATALLYSGSKQIFFDMNAGNAYDSLDTTYEVSAMLRNGQVYVPVSWVSRYFGVSYTYINGVGNGDIVRIKNGNEYLTDAQFLDAAGSLMKTRYNEYFGIVSPATPTPPGVSPAPTDVEDDHSGTYVFLNFIGAPDSKLLDTLSRYGYSASFFVTAEQAEASADLLRQAYGTGHNIGIFCQSSVDECETAANAIFAACQVTPSLVTSGSFLALSCMEYGETHGLSYSSSSISANAGTENRSAIVSRLENAFGYVGLSVELSETTLRMIPSLLSELSSESYNVLPLRETYLYNRT